MRILVATDAWLPRSTGCADADQTAEAAKAFGVDVSFLTPQVVPHLCDAELPGSAPGVAAPAKTAQLITEARPDSIHIATEGPIGLSVRRYCRKQRLPFTTSFHTRPEYISARSPIPESWIWAALRWFHGPSQA